MNGDVSSPPRGILHRALLEAVDEGLLALGDSVRRTIYRHLDKYYSVRRDEIPERPGKFADALRDMLGAGAEVLLEFMARRLYAKLGLRFEERPGWGFKDYISHVGVEGNPPPHNSSDPSQAADPWPLSFFSLNVW
ncbi:MAG: hypothetical protein ACP5K1_01870 [Candidatus Bathyarchaeia archaeon]